MRRLACLLSVAVLCSLVHRGAATADPPAAAGAGSSFQVVANTTLGLLGGVLEGSVAAFRGVPFAEPPIGDLRFAAPVPLKGGYASSPFNATVAGPGCRQKCKGGRLPDALCPATQSEDCLSLEVYAPAKCLATGGNGSPCSLPVVVWLFGGAFMVGTPSSCLYNATQLVAAGEIVFVAPNYRLGALGWMHSWQLKLGGNQGLLDQRLALEWVRDNVAAFGGNASLVTLAGQSAGASSALAHMVSPGSEGLFARAVLESSPLGVLFPTEQEATQRAEAVVQKAGCASASDGEALACLRRANASDLVAIGDVLKVPPVPPWDVRTELALAWQPTAGTADVPTQPALNGAFDKPIFIGGCTNDALVFVHGAARFLSSAEAQSGLALLFNFSVAAKVASLYAFPANESVDARPALAGFVTDYVFFCPARRLARLTAASGTGAFLYRFDQQDKEGAKHFWPKHHGYCEHAVCHGQELPFLFDTAAQCGLPVNATLSPVVRSVQHDWLSFIANGTVPKWPASAADDENKRYALEGPVTEQWSKEKCDFIDALGFNH